MSLCYKNGFIEPTSNVFCLTAPADCRFPSKQMSDTHSSAITIF